MILQLLHHGFQPLLKVAAIACAGEERSHVERKNRGVRQNLGRLALDDLLREAFGDGGLADAGIADQERVILAAAAKNLHAAFNLRRPPDQRVDVALAGLGVQVDAIFRERAFAFLLLAAVGRCFRLIRLLGAAHLARLAIGRVFGDAVRDVIDRIVARHVLLLQEKGGVAFPLGEDGDEDVGASDLRPAG